MATQRTGQELFRDDGGHGAGLVTTPEGQVVATHTQLEHNLATNIKYLRERRGLSQTGLAKKMEEIGFPWYQTTVSRIESLDRPVQVAEAVALARIFETPLEVLLGPADRQKITDDLADAYFGVEEKVDQVYRVAWDLFTAQARLYDVLGRAKEAGIKAWRVDGDGEELTVLAEKALRTLPEDAINTARDEFNTAVQKEASESRPPEHHRTGPQHRKGRTKEQKSEQNSSTLSKAVRDQLASLAENVRAGKIVKINRDSAPNLDPVDFTREVKRQAKAVGARVERRGGVYVLFPKGTSEAHVQRTLKDVFDTKNP